MLPSEFVSAVRQSVVYRPLFSQRRRLRGWLLAAAVPLIVCALAFVPLEAQTAHLGAVITLGSGFATPTGVAVDRYGNVFVADNGNSAVKEIVAVNGSIPASPVINTLGSGFANPFTVAVDGSGNVYLTDYGNHEVKEIEAVNGSIPPSPTIRILGGGFGFLFGSAVDAHGDVFVTDYGKNEVKEIVAVNGVIPASPKILSLGNGFNIPAGVALDASGNVFVGDQNNNAVKEILASSGYTTTVTLATGFSTNDGVAVDQYGNVFVANDGGNTVNEILAVNGSIPAFPTILTLPGTYSQPFDVAVDLSGNVYVADRGDNAVKEIVRAGVNFGQVNVGSTTLSPITLSFTFDTSGTLGSTSVVTLGDAGMDFYDAGGGSCMANTFYNAGAICTVNVKFGPLAPGQRNGAVELLSTGGVVLASGPVQGVGVGPQANFATKSPGAFLPASVIPVGSGFNGPGGVAVDANENIFITDSFNNAVKKVLASGAWTTVTSIGSGFSFPNGVALDGAGNVYVADTYNDEVKVIVAAGGYTNTIGSGFSNPYGVAVDGYGNVFVADFGNDAVKEIVAFDGAIPASPNILTLASGNASGINGPDGVAVDGSGNVFVANYGNGTIEEIEALNGSIPASPIIKIIGSGFNSLSNLSVDAIGNLFVSDASNNEVYELVAAGGYATVKVLGNGFLSPEAVAVSGSGNVIVAAAGTNSVQLLDYVDQPALSFAATPEGFTSSDSPQTVSVSNGGNAPLIFPLPSSGANPSVPPDFTWDPSSTCIQTTASSPQAFQLAGDASCTMAFDFKPVTAGIISSNVILTDNNLNLNGNTQAIQLIGTGNANAVMSTPTPGTVLAGPKVTFNWSSASGATGYRLWVGTSAGASNIYSSGTVTATSATPANLPTNGETVYVTLTTFYASGQASNDYVYTAATQAAMISPAPNSVLTGPSVTFTWSAGTGVTGYKLWIGSSAGKNDLYTSGTITATSAAPTNLPTNGKTIFVTLVTVYGASQVSSAYTFTAATQAALTSPTPSTTLAGPKVTFIWSPGTGAGAYKLSIGTSAGASNLYSSGTTQNTSVTPGSLPTNGETLYVTLVTVYGASQESSAYTFTAATQAALTSPTPGTTLAGATVTFNWSAGTEATGYKLWIGSSAGKNDLYSSGTITATSATPTNLPTNGETVYVTLVTVFGASQENAAYTFKAAP